MTTSSIVYLFRSMNNTLHHMQCLTVTLSMCSSIETRRLGVMISVRRDRRVKWWKRGVLCGKLRLNIMLIQIDRQGTKAKILRSLKRMKKPPTGLTTHIYKQI